MTSEVAASAVVWPHERGVIILVAGQGKHCFQTNGDIHERIRHKRLMADDYRLFVLFLQGPVDAFVGFPDHQKRSDFNFVSLVVHNPVVFVIRVLAGSEYLVVVIITVNTKLFEEIVERPNSVVWERRQAAHKLPDGAFGVEHTSGGYVLGRESCARAAPLLLVGAHYRIKRLCKLYR